MRVRVVPRATCCFRVPLQGCSFLFIYTLLSISDGEGNGTHSSTLAWKIPWAEDPGRL